MFELNISDSSNQVHDYSKKTFETIQQLIYFLYHDEFEEITINQKIIEEFEDIKDYYQLNTNSIIDLYLNDEDFKRKIIQQKSFETFEIIESGNTPKNIIKSSTKNNCEIF
ncbi:hypothetical protein M0811_11949 [Anaeramoeba ignava]|uniref:Uncharacterized protein n=1 Tax=Anaeramoeba ignava TaxID=1746090 RepID=A0A9Q0LAY8_ANAIG|nr:hypothetical protein M0811_11949 [Anaeramoeba ignava]